MCFYVKPKGDYMKEVLVAEDHLGESVSLNDYTHIRAYHACRPISAEEYLEKGIIPFTHAAALDSAVTLFQSSRATYNEVAKVVRQVWTQYGDSSMTRVWLSLSRAELLGASCHYLIYRSEFLNAVSMHLGCRDKLKSIGRPTIVVCDIPLKDIGSTWLDGIEKAIEDETFGNWAIPISRVDSACIVEFQHPTGVVYDPYLCEEYVL